LSRKKAGDWVYDFFLLKTWSQTRSDKQNLELKWTSDWLMTQNIQVPYLSNAKVKCMKKLLRQVSLYIPLQYCKTCIFRVHQIFANFASRKKSRN